MSIQTFVDIQQHIIINKGTNMNDILPNILTKYGLKYEKICRNKLIRYFNDPKITIPVLKFNEIQW